MRAEAELREAQQALQRFNTQLMATVEQRTQERDRIWRPFERGGADR